MTQLLESSHPVVGAVAGASEALAAVGHVDPLFMRQSEQVAALGELAVVEARTAELKARLLVALDRADVAAEVGARDLAAWLNQQTRVGVRAARDEIAFAHRLQAHPRVAEAMQAGESRGRRRR